MLLLRITNHELVCQHLKFCYTDNKTPDLDLGKEQCVSLLVFLHTASQKSKSGSLIISFDWIKTSFFYLISHILGLIPKEGKPKKIIFFINYILHYSFCIELKKVGILLSQRNYESEDQNMVLVCN